MGLSRLCAGGRGRGRLGRDRGDGCLALAAAVAYHRALWIVGGARSAGPMRRGESWHGPVLHGMTATSALLVVSSLDAPLARHFLGPGCRRWVRRAPAPIFSKRPWGTGLCRDCGLLTDGETRRGPTSRGVGGHGNRPRSSHWGHAHHRLRASPGDPPWGGASHAHLAPLVPLFTAIGDVGPGPGLPTGGSARADPKWAPAGWIAPAPS